MGLHGVKRCLVDEWRNSHDHDLASGLQRLVLGAFVELVLADIGLASQDAVNLTNAPPPAVTGEDASLVEMSGNILDAHRTARSVTYQGEPIN
ncbi:MAG: hypothetical protein WCE20_11560 [Rhizomicrobium sp.]